MLHANLKAVFSPQIASMCGGGGDTGVHCCAHSGILEELLSVFDNQVVWFECCLLTLCDGLCEFQLRFMAQNTVLCFPSDNEWGSLTYVEWSKSLSKKYASNRKTASCHKRGLIQHIGSLYQNYLTSDTKILI